MELKTLLVMPTRKAIWVREMQLPFPPFPGLGIRIDAYDVLNVDNVVIGDEGYDVTCLVRLKGAGAGDPTKAKCEAWGFVLGPYP